MRLTHAILISLMIQMTSARYQLTVGDWFNKGIGFHDPLQRI
jgi:hypothetical protein